MSKLWTCPYCNRDCTIDENDTKNLSTWTEISKDYGYYYSILIITVCPNPQCREQTISLNIYEYNPRKQSVLGKKVYSWHLKPESEAKPFPSYIPKQLISDYKEACLIKSKSPKASATLSRRCLQGMIRDFWGIRKGRLLDEINELEKKIDTTTWKAIDSVRKVGNIGAHMEKDVNLIIDVNPKEAGLLIGLIETLFEEWYIARHDRETKMKNLVKIAKKKQTKKKSGTTRKST